MSWLDSVLAVPTCGVQFNTDFGILHKYAEIIAPLAERIHSEYGSVSVSYEKVGHISITSTSTGLIYKFDPSNITVEFKYMIEEIKQPGAFPYFKSIDVEPYTEVLEKLSSEFVHTVKIFADEFKFIPLRYGIVADIETTFDSIPPGVELLIENLQKPWNRKVPKFNVNITSEINETETFIERCHHSINFDTLTEAQDIKIRLDWQRLFKDPEVLKSANSKKIIKDCNEKAINYFQLIGEGGLNG